MASSTGMPCLSSWSSSLPTWMAFAYYHQTRTHLALDKDAPDLRPIPAAGTIVQLPEVGGLHHRYLRQAA
jgi:hypothetical protein